MMDDQKVTLRRAPLFRGVSGNVLSTAVKIGDLRSLAQHDRLLKPGAADEGLHLVLSGGLSIRAAGSGDPMARLGPGACVGERSLVEGHAGSLEVVAEEPTVVLSFDRRRLWSLIDSSAEFARNLLRILAGRSDVPDERIEPAREPDVPQQGAQEIPMIDPLTGLRDRRWLDDMFARQLQRTARTAQPASLLIVSVDYSTEGVEGSGSLLMDALLHRTAQALMAGLRPPDLLARYGPAEFAVLLPGMDAAASLAIAERLRRAIEVSLGEEATASPYLTISMSATTRRPFESFQALIERAEATLGTARETGGSTAHQ